MIELRWFIPNSMDDEPRLQYRIILWRVDAAGAMSVVPVEWGPWIDVPEVTE